MSEITLPPSDLEFLRALLVANDPGPLSFYPAHLSQLSTRGLTHNHTPIATIKTITSPILESTVLEIPIFRFYFDGLIIHFHRHFSDDGYTASLGNLVVGSSTEIDVTVIPYEISFQAENLRRVVAEAKFPDVVDKLA